MNYKIVNDTDFNLRTSKIIEYKSHIRVNVDRKGKLFFCDVNTYLMNLVTTTRNYNSPSDLLTINTFPFNYYLNRLSNHKPYSSGHALGIWICGCSLLYRRELWASNSAGVYSSKSPKICGCKRWCPKDLWVHLMNMVSSFSNFLWTLKHQNWSYLFCFCCQEKSKKKSECALAHFFTHHSKAFADVSLSQQLFVYICHSEQNSKI